MKNRVAYSSFLFLFAFLFGCKKDELNDLEPDAKVDQVENSSALQTCMLVTMSTGSDDLRSGNRAFISLVLVDGRVITEQLLSSGMGSHTTASSRIVFPVGISATQIRSISIRHDGSPRSGQIFDFYDIWDLRTLRIQLTDAFFRPTTSLYNSANDARVNNLVARFTGEFRRLDLPIRAIGSEPDFVILSITALPRGLGVLVENRGPGDGVVTQVSASAFGGFTVHDSRYVVGRNGGRTLIPVGFAHAGSVTCIVTGVSSLGRPEVVTTNNKLTSVIPR